MVCAGGVQGKGLAPALRTLLCYCDHCRPPRCEDPGLAAFSTRQWVPCSLWGTESSQVTCSNGHRRRILSTSSVPGKTGSLFDRWGDGLREVKGLPGFKPGDLSFIACVTVQEFQQQHSLRFGLDNSGQGGCPGQGRMFSSILSFCPLDTPRHLPPETARNVSRHCYEWQNRLSWEPLYRSRKLSLNCLPGLSVGRWVDGEGLVV